MPHINLSEIELEPKSIGKGAFGVVYKVTTSTSIKQSQNVTLENRVFGGTALLLSKNYGCLNRWEILMTS